MKTTITLLFILIFSFSTVYAATFTLQFNDFSDPSVPPVTDFVYDFYPSDFRITRQGVPFNFENVGSGTTGLNQGALSPFLNPTSSAPFRIEWAYPTTSVSISVGDNEPDEDNVTVRAFDCQGRDRGTGTAQIPGGNTTFRAIQFNIYGRGICSIEMIGGSPERPHSVYYDNLSITTDNNPNAFTRYFVSDFTVYRPSSGNWFVDRYSASGSPMQSAITYGAAGDKPVPADYQNDGAADFAVYRNGSWFIWLNCAGYFTTLGGAPTNCGFQSINFGLPTDIPLPADYDGDGKADIAVFRPSNGTWYILQSFTSEVKSVQFGQAGDIPVPGFYDADLEADIAVFRPSNGTWYQLRSQSGFRATQFGQNGDKPVQADYDGDAITDLAVYRNGTWYILQSFTNQIRGAAFGTATDIPVPSNFPSAPSGTPAIVNGKAKIAVWRPSTGTWYVLTDTGFYSRQWGQNGDIPVSFVNN